MEEHLKYAWTDRHKTFINDLFERLNGSGIRFFVLRNYEELPERNTGKDVDVVIEPGAYNHVKAILQNCMRELNIPYYSVSFFDRMRCWYIMDPDAMFGIHVDIIENEVYHGFEFFDFDYLYEHVVAYKNFFALDPAHDTVMLLIQNIVAYKSLKEKYRNTISDNYKKYKKEINIIIEKFWSKSVSHKMIQSLENNDFDQIVKDSSLYGRNAKWNIFIKKPFKTFAFNMRFLCDKLWRVVVCPAKYRKSFAIEAPDGTGKTTFLNKLIEDLLILHVGGEARFNVFHFRPNILPNLGAAGEKVGVMKQDIDFENPHRAKQVGVFQSLIRMTYYWLDYVIGMPILLRRYSTYDFYTIFDRYIYDFLADQERSRINLPYWLRKVYTKLVIQPDIVFVLQTDPRIVYKRKQELTLDEIDTQMRAFAKLIDNKRFIRLDASKSPDEISRDALHYILKKYMKKVC